MQVSHWSDLQTILELVSKMYKKGLYDEQGVAETLRQVADEIEEE